MKNPPVVGRRKPFRLTAKQKEALTYITAHPEAVHCAMPGGSRCIAGDSIINGHTQTIAELAAGSGPILVYTANGIREAERPYYKGTDFLFIVTTESGKRIKVTSDHRFWSGEAWLPCSAFSVGMRLACLRTSLSYPLLSTAAHDLSAFLPSAHHLLQTPQDSLENSYIYPHQYDVQPLSEEAFVPTCRAYGYDEEEHIHTDPRVYSLESNNHTRHLQQHEAEYNQNGQASRLRASAWLSSRLVLFGFRGGMQVYVLFRRILRGLLQFLAAVHHYVSACLPQQTMASGQIPAVQASLRVSSANLIHSFVSNLPVQRFSDLITAVHDTVQHTDPSHIQKSSDTPMQSGYTLERIISIQKTSTPEDYYTTTVDDCQQYFANDILHHNSGKTFFIIHLMIVRAIKYGGSRHIICRLRFSHAKTAIWMDTLPKVLSLMGLCEGRDYHLNRTDFVVVFPNGSEIFVDGLDDAQRVEKILGREFCTIFFDEISQIPYDTVTTVHSRLAMFVDDPVYGICRNMSFYALNPGLRSHWSYQIWFLKKDPVKKVPLASDVAETYIHFQMNPEDNLENLNPRYLELLAGLPEKKRLRFLAGQYGDIDGQIFDNYTIIPYIPDDIKDIAIQTIGIDFGFTVDPASAVNCWFVRKKYAKSQLYIEQLVYSTGLTNSKLGAAVLDSLRGLWQRRLIAEYGETEKLVAFDEFREVRENEIRVKGDNLLSGIIYAYADCAEPKSIVELNEYFRGKVPQISVLPALKGRDSVIAGIDWMQDLEIFITAASSDVIAEFDSYEYEKDIEGKATTEPMDDNNHCIPGDSFVVTSKGLRKMRSLTVGEQVMTREGYKEILHVWNKGKGRTMLVNTLEATAEHQVLINGAFAALDTVRYGDILISCKHEQQNTQDSFGTDTPNRKTRAIEGIINAAQCGFIEKYGKMLSEKSRKDITFTIKTVIQGIMRSIILSCVARVITRENMKRIEMQGISLGESNIWQKFVTAQKLGMPPQKAGHGTKSTQQQASHVRTRKIGQLFVDTVAKALTRKIITANTAQTLAKLLQEENLELIMSQKCVSFATKNSAQANMIQNVFALEAVSVRAEGSTKTVYDIMVDTKHEFVSNGYVVSNSIDATRYSQSNQIGRNVATILEIGAE